MNKRTTKLPRISQPVLGAPPRLTAAPRSMRTTAALAILASALLAPSAHGQYIRFKATPLRVTVPVNTSGIYVVSNQVSIAGLSNDPPVTLSVTGLPAGATYTLSDFTGNPLGSITNGTAVRVNLACTNIDGVYPFSLTGSAVDTNGNAVAGNLMLTLEAGYVWNGTNNAALGGAGNWSDASQWLGSTGGSLPGDSPGHHVLFTDKGGQTNFLLTVPGVSTNLLTNSVVDADTTISSIRFCQTISSNAIHVLSISPGKTLTMTGAGGFSVLRDNVNELVSSTTPMTVVVTGTNGALVVTNPAANFLILEDNVGRATLDLTGLDNFSATVNQFGLGDYTFWPNYQNLLDNGYGNSVPRKFTPSLHLARTNYVKATYADPFNYTNFNTRTYGYSINASPTGGQTSPYATNRLGLTNAFFADSICLGHGASQSYVLFNTSNSYAYFRGTNGGRMSMFGIADQTSLNTNNVTSSCKATIDFTGGTIDMLVDKLQLAHDRVHMGQAQCVATVTVGGGTIDANEVIIGYQEHPGQSTTQTYCQGTLTLRTNTLFKVNGNLHLGYTTETNTAQVTDAALNFGKLTVQGTGMVSNILVGGITKLSTGNSISVSSGGTLIVSNTIAGPDKMLDSLSLSGGATLALHIDGANPNPYVYANSITATAASANLQIARIVNLGANLQLPLATWTSTTVPSFTLRMPPGPLAGSLITIGNTLYLNILTNSPRNLAWRGYQNGNWDYTTTNWLDLDASQQTAFAPGDNAVFDDGASTTSLSLVDPQIIPGAMTMTNNTQTYVFGDGGGAIAGSATLTKYGSAPLQINAMTTIGYTINEGSLSGTGATGTTTIGTNATADFSGTINGSLTCRGAMTLESGATLNGNLGLASNAILTNSGNINGLPSIPSGSLLYNAGNITYSSTGTATVSSNGTLITGGSITGGTLNIDGVLKALDGSSFTMSATVSIDAKGLFIPGGDGIGSTSVNLQGTATNGGRILLAAGSTNIFKVNIDTGSFTKVYAKCTSFGPNQTPPQYNCGGTIVIQNVGSTPFGADQSFQFFDYISGGGFIADAGLNTTNSYPLISPAVPGPGLAWDLSGLQATIDRSGGGVIRIRTVSTVPTGLTSTTSIGTNNIQIGTNNVPTNTMVLHFQWPSDHIGWHLETQANPINVGLGTNWNATFTGYSNAYSGFNSYTTNDIWVTNIWRPDKNPDSAATFYRLKFP